jgi:DNA-binding CsgD family transcriptional regulator
MPHPSDDTEAEDAQVWDFEHIPDPVDLGAYQIESIAPRHMDFAQTLAASSADVGLSCFLLDLYGAAVREPIGAFEKSWILALKSLLDFDAAWTGVASIQGSLPVNHSAFTYNLSADFGPEWKKIAAFDPFADLASLVPGQASSVTLQTQDIAPEFQEWARRYDLQNLASVCAIDNGFELISFLSVYRHDHRAVFSESDLRKLELVIPHIAAATRTNRRLQLASKLQHSSERKPRAICDAFGVFHRADPEFRTILKSLIPDWNENSLPEDILQNAQDPSDADYVWNGYSVEMTEVAGLWVVALQEVSPLAVLPPRELEAIQFYSQGASYKEVAREMGIAPSTVRHHIRCAYKRMGINNKAQIAQILSKSSRGI